MDRWIAAAIDYVPRWLELQMRLTGQTGCAVAIAHRGRPVLELALGHADVDARARLTSRHRFRVASHSKTFTSAGVMKLRDAGRLRLDDPVGRVLGGLPPHVASLTYAQLMSHGAGLVRDGTDGRQWTFERPFKTRREVLDELDAAPPLPPAARFKYSNHGYSLLGMAIEAIAGEPWADWIRREVVRAAGLDETLPDGPVPAGVPLAAAHTALLPLGRRAAFSIDVGTDAIAPAGGFVSTASDLVRFYASLDPAAKGSVLSADARREMARRLWPDPDSSIARWYGLGTVSNTFAGPDGPSWDGVGHTGVFPGCVSRTTHLAAPGLTVSVLTNAADGLCQPWLDGIVHVLRRFAAGGAPTRRTAAWTGRWWTPSLALDLVPMADKVMVAVPAQPDPFLDAAVLEVHGRRGGEALGTVVRDGGYGRHAEAARLVDGPDGRPAALRLGGWRLEPEAAVTATLKRRILRPRRSGR